MAHNVTVTAGSSTGVVGNPTGTRKATIFLVGLGLLYILLSFGITFALDPFWSANWDAVTYIEAPRPLWDGGSLFDLYEKSREARPWPYAYPPLYALVLAPFIWLADLVTSGPAVAGPQLVAVRLPILLADIGIAALLYRLLSRETGKVGVGRLGAAVWLLNPVLFYHTAVQAHFESLWLLPTLGAYYYLAERGRRQSGWAALLLALAVAVKQSAILYALPVGIFLLLERRWAELVRFVAAGVLLVGGLCLPFYLYSEDFRYLVIEYVSAMPMQIQSWQLWTLGLEQFRVEQTRTTFPTVQYAVWITLALNALLSLWALRKGRSWYAIGSLVTLAFLLTSQKAMGYHYPMPLLWLTAYALRIQRFGFASLLLLWTSWVLVSPYFAPWAEASHLPFYALLGTLNSLFFLTLLWQVLMSDEEVSEGERYESSHRARTLLNLAALLALGFLFASLAHPLRTLLPHTLPALLCLLGGVLLGTLLSFGPVSRWAARHVGLPSIARGHPSHGFFTYLAVAFLFIPLFFTWFTMTAEITAVIEKGVTEAWELE